MDFNQEGNYAMPTVLVVDDAVFMRTTIKRMLENHQFEVVGEAANGAGSSRTV